MSEHSINIDIQELAQAIQKIRLECDIIEKIIQKGLVEQTHDREYASIDKRS